jgi:hypothetical protein
MFPLITASDYHEGWAYQGGAFALGFNESWTMTFLAPDTFQRLMKTKPELGEKLRKMLQGVDDMCQWFRSVPLKDFPLLGEAEPYFYDWLAHPDDDDYWARWNIEARLSCTTHGFDDQADGGLQTVTANEPSDMAQIYLIRDHLADLANRFARGNFADQVAPWFGYARFGRAQRWLYEAQDHLSGTSQWREFETRQRGPGDRHRYSQIFCGTAVRSCGPWRDTSPLRLNSMPTQCLLFA